MMKLPDAEPIGPEKVVVAVELKVLAPVTERVEPTVRALETVRLAAERAVTAPHWKTTPYMVMALELAVRMRYFIEVPLGWVETSMLESPYRVVPSSRGVPIITRVLVAHVVPPSLETAAIRSVLRVKEADEYAWMARRAELGVLVAVKARERRGMPVDVSDVYRIMTIPEPPAAAS